MGLVVVVLFLLVVLVVSLVVLVLFLVVLVVFLVVAVVFPMSVFGKSSLTIKRFSILSIKFSIIARCFLHSNWFGETESTFNIKKIK